MTSQVPKNFAYTGNVLTSVKAGDYTVRGVSVGGIYTSLFVPEIGSMFDVGVALRSFAGARRLFLSHGHVDHLGALTAFLGIRALTGKTKPLKVFLPAEISEPLAEALGVLTKLQRYSLAIDAVEMKPGDEVSLGSNLFVRAFRTYHPVPSLGYLFLRRVSKLKRQFSSLDGKEIARRRTAGEDLFDDKETAVLAYATDTLAKVLDAEPAVCEAQTLIIECTFLDAKKTVQAAHAGCHIHLDDLLERADALRNESIVLMHFSQLYQPAEVHEILAARCPPKLLQRIVAFAPTDGSWPG